MKKIIISAILMTCITMGYSAAAQDDELGADVGTDEEMVDAPEGEAEGDSGGHTAVEAEAPIAPVAEPTGPVTHIVGAHLMLGGAGIIEDSDSEEIRARFAGGFGFYYNYQLKNNLALAAGLDFIGRGGRYDVDVQDSTQETKIYWRRMELPFGVVYEPIPNLRVGGALVLSFTLGGKYKIDDEDYSFKTEDWDKTRRFNINPRLYAGYTIPVGPITLVPGLMWEMDLINVYKEDDDDDTDDGDIALRAMNLMVTIGAQYGLPF
ncbi:MAG: PorT family protein [Deltaproteobacteria bacterium]|nr:PorT family protein [Deltaproteobacteria bacterium]